MQKEQKLSSVGWGALTALPNWVTDLNIVPQKQYCVQNAEKENAYKYQGRIQHGSAWRQPKTETSKGSNSRKFLSSNSRSVLLPKHYKF